jgi:hypothetical protein
MNGKRITVVQGTRGWYALLVDDDGPIRSGLRSYRMYPRAVQEAREWAAEEGYALADHLNTQAKEPLHGPRS